ncbi:hypothetical protein ABW20_dc0106446 [Dactylellina cionopaga]|nr:hypothetical protein ABW20_dc0106446 [Dactylellina cionopaga]
MFRTAIRQSSRLLTSSMRSAAATGARVLPQQSTLLPSVSVAPQSLFGVRCYSSGGPPSKSDIESRIVDLLKGFDKASRGTSLSSPPSQSFSLIIETILQITDSSKITATSHFSNDLGLDSLDTVEVVMAIEEEFSVEIPDKEADAIQSGMRSSLP